EAAESLTLEHIDLSGGAVLHAGSVYIIPLMESLSLPDKLSAAANPKSSTGRVDVFARLITDRGERFDSIGRGYSGRLFLEVSPKTFSVRVQPGTRLSQIRFFRSWPEHQESSRLASSHSLVWDAEGEPALPNVNTGLWFSVDLIGEKGLAGWRAKRNCPVLDLERIGYYDPLEFWDPIASVSQLILGPSDFFILSSRERVRIPPAFAAEMAPYDEAMGEFRVHYAGFFDPGFGYGEGNLRGTRAVLEVRTHEVPYALKHGQRIGRLMYQPMLAEPGRLYGSTGSSYQDQGLGLSKHFRR
ncbi:MAG TPA: 2'-deoxycytidine 5'-triphosphate deaminase, partial [Tepidiformaceae bacterium]|nr:2'-deoxycytidine 5'-triphosphate deaminase [Tepidiformaceae bacterium]